ncbi:MAG: ABC transporter ATP-binding protein [bacterium]|nr:ABC transporter ATP-binding protein [bacterium]
MHELRRLLGYLKPYLLHMILGATLLSVSGGLMAAVVSTIKPLVNDVLGTAPAAPGDTGMLEWFDGVVPAGEAFDWAREHAFVQVPLILIVIFFARGVLLYFGQYLTIKSGASVIRDLRAELYESVAFQSLDFFQTHATGVIMSRLLNDVTLLKRISTVMLADLVRVGAMVPFLLLAAFIHDWRMSLIAVVALPLLAYPMVRLGKRLRSAATASQEYMGELSSRLNEAVSGAKVVQSFGMERYEIGRLRQSLNQMLRADLRAGRAQALAPAVMELLGAVFGAALFFTAGLFIARNTLDAGDFAVILFCLGLLFVSIRRLNTIYAELQRARSAAVRVFRMLDHERKVKNAPGATDLLPFERRIRFDGVEFSYGADAPVLRGIELSIAKGETVALVGSSGAGKSTIANLVPRFYDVTEGRVLVDGRDVREVRIESLREQIGMVTQETVLFDDTVRNNIAYGRADVPLERVEEVARAAHADGFIRELPDGYDTVLGERGARLSMGQRQRLTIARALLKDPPLLILDEATSALDAESEVAVQQALEVLMRGRTSLVIAHRLSTIRSADRIVVMDAGRIVEEGTHDQLLADGGAYARLHEFQFRDAPAT